jgi:serine/threonine-protein kinase
MPAAAEKPAAKALRAGQRLAGKLTLIRRVGHGGMGAVWAARNEATGADVALKVLRPDKEASEEAIARFRHEARLGAMLAHRSITRVYDFVEEPDGTLILVMELLRGETLEAYYKSKGSLSNEEAVAIIVPILSALEHAHEHDVVHRDIKPQNIYLHIDPDGQVTPKLLDFGIAKVPEANFHTLFGRVLGTPAYMSPEQIRASQDIDGRSDLFGVGVVLYEIISGTCPFDAAAPSAALANVLETPVDPDPRIDPRLWLEIERAMAKQPYERHATANELSNALRSATGKTEAELVASLRRSKPPPRLVPEEPEADAPAGGPAPGETLSAGGQSMAHDAIPTARGWTSWWVIAAAAVFVIGVAAFTIQRMTGRRAQAAAATATSGVTATPTVEPSVEDPTEVIELESPTPAGSHASGATRAKPRWKGPPRGGAGAKPHPSASATAKPIATTPGF